MSIRNRIDRLYALASKVFPLPRRLDRWNPKPFGQQQDPLPPDATDLDRMVYEDIKAMHLSTCGERARAWWPE